MKIFILDDEIHSGGIGRRDRLKWILSHHMLTCATSYEDGVKKFQPPYDLLILDHDMRGFYDDSEYENTGFQFCRWLINRGILEQVSLPPVIIHSWNPEGKRNMSALLTRYGFEVEEAHFGDTYLQHIQRKYGK